MNAHTREILFGVSPYFDSNTLLENWETLSTDDAPLVSQTTQGMYPPGSLLAFILSTQLHLLQDETILKHF